MPGQTLQGSIVNKPRRNPDGTFVGDSNSGNGGGRPSEVFSFRHQVKLRAANDPKMIQEAINTLVSIATDPRHPQCTTALDKLIKLNGNYDPQETKDVTPPAPHRPLEGLSAKELKEALKVNKTKPKKRKKKK